MKKTIAILLALLLCASLIAVPAMGAQDQIAVVAKVPSDWVDPCAWAWDANGNNAFAAWPGELMEDLGDGWYYIYVPAGMTGIIINGNGGSVQTLDGAMDGDKNAWITVGENVEGNKYALTVSYEKQNTAEIPAPEGTVEPPTTPPTPETTDTYTVHVKVPASWTAPKVWAWKGTQNVATGAWPGNLNMTKGANGWWSIKITSDIEGVLICNENGTEQTADVKVTTSGANIYITVGEKQADGKYAATSKFESVPSNGDETALFGMVVVMMTAVLGMGITVVSKKKFF